ncbi:MAG TPA: heme ABC exporter ATP-binding protein CcmA [Gemmatimonadales bacterium]|nr:heme ABC exporter ATP-binding protein CcmA [Gemmatimonadales bacterium]
MLRAEGLRHAFGPARALDDISFALTAGRTLVVFGPNGAGKTTLLRVLAGLIKPQGGRVYLEGGRRAVGWIGHHAHLYGHLTVMENLRFWGGLYGLSRDEAAARAEGLLARLGLADRAGQAVRTLSRGQLQRAAIARALLHDPSVLLLDEPFTGLDLAAAAEFRRLLAGLAGRGRVLVMATHNVEEGVELASDVAFQLNGRFVRLEPRGDRTAAEIAEAYRRAVTGA